MKLYLLIFLMLCASTYSNGQISNLSKTSSHLYCGTKHPTPAQYRYTRDIMSKIPIDRNAGTTGIPIQVHIVQDGGVGGPSLEDLAKALANLNAFYSDANIEFYYKDFPNYVNNSDYYQYNTYDDDVDGNDSESGLVSLFTAATDAVNIYFVNSITISGGFTACGYAYFPANLSYSNRIVMNNGCLLNAPNGTFVHEFGHYFNLYHTHQGTENGNTHPTAENVARTGANANCTTNGDLLCDTEADPRYSSGNFNFGTCSIPTPGVDAVGDTYVAPIENVMSYYPDGCGGLFTAEQYTRMAQALVTRQGHTAYSLDAPPASVNVPTSFTATLDDINSEVDLSWTDAASNEMGYIVERSTTSSSAGFKALENIGTGANATSLSDNTIEANTTYWYRIKPTNGDKDTYSTVEQVDVGVIYCGIGSGACDEFISRVQMGGVDNMSACSAGGYHNYTGDAGLIIPVEVGVTTPITVTNGPPVYTGDQCGIFIDWNQDGDFNGANETISVSGGPSSFTANITPPNDAIVGNARMRIRITYNTTPTYCGTDTWGEAEDYTLAVSSSLPVEFFSFSGRNLELHNELTWQTASEKNNDYFSIERLNSSNNRFEAIGKLSGAGDSYEMLDYKWMDYAPLVGSNYYRIKQVDFDGKFSYSETILVDWGINATYPILKIFPNPAKETIHLQTNIQFTGKEELIIYNTVGRVVKSLLLDQGQNNQVQININDLGTGVYYLKLNGISNEIGVQRFIKK